MKGQPLIIQTPQGDVPNRLLQIERESWREFRALAESLPLSPWGRARLGLKAKLPKDQVEMDIGLPPRLRVAGE
jgi:phage terminase small subunit